MSTNARQVPGTGLSIPVFALILAASVTVFLVWGGVLWRAPREASHVLRFVVSYLVVLPLVVVALAAGRRWSFGHALASTGLLWCAKLVISAALFFGFARGTAVEYAPVVAKAPAARPGTAADDSYLPAEAGFARGNVTGRVLALGRPVSGGVVYLDRPAPGLPSPAPASVELTIENARHLAPLQIAHARDTVRVQSRDTGLHTAHVLRDGRALGNQPIPSGGTVTVALHGRGLYQIRCDNHPREQAWLVVVDHPYAARTAADGSFTLPGAPAGATTLQVVALQGGSLWRDTRPISVDADKSTDITIEAAPAHAAASSSSTPEAPPAL